MDRGDETNDDCERCWNYGYVSRGQDEIGCPECNPTAEESPMLGKPEIENMLRAMDVGAAWDVDFADKASRLIIACGGDPGTNTQERDDAMDALSDFAARGYPDSNAPSEVEQLKARLARLNSPIQDERNSQEPFDTEPRAKLIPEAVERIRKADDAAASVGAGSWVPHRSASPPTAPDDGENGATRTDVAVGLLVALVAVAMLAGFGPFGVAA
jgi:hypothetical protein